MKERRLLKRRLNQAMDSFMFRVHIAEQEFAMDAPQGQNQFFERCARDASGAFR